MNFEASVAVKPTASKSSKYGTLLRELTPDSDDEAMPDASRDPRRPWLEEFEEYYDSRPEILPPGMSMVSWWGVSAVYIILMYIELIYLIQACAGRLPTWRSLARDRLAIPASSVSSERAFSAGGITISKRRNRLKGDIVEALQVLKSLIKGKDMYRTSPITPINEDDDPPPEEGDANDGWDCFLDDNVDNYEPDVSVE